MNSPIKRYCFTAIFFLLLCTIASAENIFRYNRILNGNKITVEMWNYGSFSAPGNRTTDFVWEGLGHAYEINFFVCAEVEVPEGSHIDAHIKRDKYGQVLTNTQGDTLWAAYVISDGLKSGGAEISTIDYITRWGWQPVQFANDGSIEYLNASSSQIASSNDADLDADNKPDNWPESWWNDSANNYLWPGTFGWGQQIADQEAFYGMDDRDNHEFEYYPFVDDSLRKGLGLEVETRTYQLADVYEDILFVTFNIKNVSDKDLDKMIFGVWGDPHIGGSNDWRDDLHSIDRTQQLLYAWDEDGLSIDNPDIVPGYFGIQFIQTPGVADDGIDNDQDGMIDESQTDGIDNDGDWDAGFDDLGVDGIAGTSDLGEGDGIPTLGEPDFEIKDMDEVDMLGLTSCNAPSFSSTYISDDDKVWTLLQPGVFESTPTAGDFILLGGTGHYQLKKGESVLIGVALVFGQDLTDLQSNAQYAKSFYSGSIGSQTNLKSILISSPQPSSNHTNQVEVQWETSAMPAETQLSLSYSIDNGLTWKMAAHDIPNSGSYEWDVSGLTSSAFYKIRMRSLLPKADAFGASTGFFTIDNSAEENVVPEVFLLLDKGTQLSNNFKINWLAGDADGDSLNLMLIISSEVVQDTIFVSGDSYTLNTGNYANGSYTITLRAADIQSSVSDNARVNFKNDFESIPEKLIYHKSGYATGTVYVNVIDGDNLNKTQYFIYINDSTADYKTYSVYDSLNQYFVIKDDLLPLFPDYGRVFDGLSVSFDEDAFKYNEEKSGWSPASQTTLNFIVFREYHYKADPYDYEIKFYDEIVDTTVTNNYTNFIVTDLLNNQKMKLACSSENPAWGPEYHYFILRGGNTASNIVWQFYGNIPDSNYIEPKYGDVFYLYTDKPFTSTDTYMVDASPMSIHNDKEIIPKTSSLAQNYPNPFNNVTTINVFISLNTTARLDVYNILGKKIKTLYNGQLSQGEHQFRWGGKNDFGKDVSSGVYFYRLITKNNVMNKKAILIK